jgi:dihydroorotase
MSKELVLVKPDDWHLHLRDGELMAFVLKDTAQSFSRALVMPNLNEPVSTLKKAAEYRQRILEARPTDSEFQPMMTLYLTAETRQADLRDAISCEWIQAMKLYPAGTTTNSSAGIQKIEHCFPIFETMQKNGMVLSIHGEVTDADVDIFDREKVFIERVLIGLVKQFPELKIVLEHLTTLEGVQFIETSGPFTAATITAHHLALNRNDLLVGGIKPHLYCLPIVKTEDDQQALIGAATSGNPKFFLGTDSAPHLQKDKETAVGKAGIYSANAALPIYAEVFESVGKLDRLEGFASFYGADFYGLGRNQNTLILRNENFRVPEIFEIGKGGLVPLKCGQTLTWQLA